MTLSSATPAQCSDGTIRLVGGPNPQTGRVEICMGSHWGTVCDSSYIWKQDIQLGNARVICKQLEFEADSKLYLTVNPFTRQ